MTLKEKLIDVANGLESESIRYPRMKTIDVVNMLINISNMKFDEPDQCVQIAKDYAEQEAIEFSGWKDKNTYPHPFNENEYQFFSWHNDQETYTQKELYQLFKNRENER